MKVSIVTLKQTATGWRWGMMDPRNGEKIGAATQGYSRRQDAIANLERVTGLRIPSPRSRAKFFAFRLEETTKAIHTCAPDEGRPLVRRPSRRRA